MKTSLKKLIGIGEKTIEKFNRLNIYTVEDLLFHLPFRYEDKTKIIQINNLVVGQKALIAGIIESAEVSFSGKKKLFIRLRDESGFISIVFFNFFKQQKDMLLPSRVLSCYGEIKSGYLGFEIVNPEFNVVYSGSKIPVESTLTPVYSTTDGLHQKKLRTIINQALQYLDENKLDLEELLPENILKCFSLPNLSESIHFLHQPPKNIDIKQLESEKHPCRRRLAFEELAAHHLSFRLLKLKNKSELSIPIKRQSNLVKKFIDNLNFTLTNAQLRVFQEIEKDMGINSPMMRLIQGDVGSGKTAVAMMSCVVTVENDCQVAVMAPTELLAEQHYERFKSLFDPIGITTTFLTGSVKSKERIEVLEKIYSNRVNVVIGTHALFQETVEFSRLALVIIDEQHRFGVNQRFALREKGKLFGYSPHQLMMTATPIPRTLAMSLYADLDHSIIDELPKGRRPVKTVVMPNSKRDSVIESVSKICKSGYQAYWVCALIEESDTLQTQAAEVTFELLKKSLPQLKIALVHGRLSSYEKDRIMNCFQKGEYDLLVSTTVIEVGIDVPKANLMIIENAERFGLSQLHQLRGRIGRGGAESFCVLLYKSPLTELAKERLAIIRETNDGFKIAEKDLELRGPGEVFGLRQAGMTRFRIADLTRDADLFESIQKAADEMINCNNDVIGKLIDRWGQDSDKF